MGVHLTEKQNFHFYTFYVFDLGTYLSAFADIESNRGYGDMTSGGGQRSAL